MQVQIALWAGLCLLLTAAAIVAYSAAATIRRANIARAEAVGTAEEYAVAVSKQVDGYAINMAKNRKPGDALDADFERY